jgi:dephospho-CoA kinase
MTTDGILVEQIKKEFGTLSYESDGTPDRAFLSNLVFERPDKLKALNALVHPRVALDYDLWVAAQQERRYLIREAALLFEAGVSTSMGKLIVVFAPEQIRIKRVLARDPHRTENEIRAIIKNQWPDEEKMKRADEVIYNDETQLVVPQVLRLHDKFLSISKPIS